MSTQQLTYRQAFEIHFSKLRQCTSDEVSRHIMGIVELFPFSELSDRTYFAETVYTFAEPLKKQKPSLFAYASFVRAFHYFYSEQYENALLLFAETEKLFEEQHDVNGVTICLGACGSIHRTMGIVDLSLKGMLSAYQQLKDSEIFAMFAMAMGVTVANIYAEQKHYEEAIQQYRDMLNMPERSFKYYWDVYSLQGLAKVYLAHEQPAEALQSLRKAMDIAEKNNHANSICNSLSELGNYYFQVGDLPQSEEYYKRSLVLREQNNFKAGAVTSCIRLGEIYIRQGRFDEALEILHKGLKIAEEIKIKPKMFQAHRLLSEAYEHKNVLDKSLNHYKLFEKLHGEVEAEDNARRVKNVKAYFEAEQTKKENAIIKQQKEEIERKNIELQHTIDELTRARIGKKARAITLLIAIIMFIFEDTILHIALTVVNSENYFIGLIVKMTIIFSLAPINRAIEKYLLKKVIREKKQMPVAVAG